jgi:hypothetical protein
MLNFRTDYARPAPPRKAVSAQFRDEFRQQSGYDGHAFLLRPRASDVREAKDTREAKGVAGSSRHRVSQRVVSE